jgi:Ca2+-binding EF-hand superfamily protein
MVVGFIRGNPQQDNALFAMPNIARPVAEQTPRWFRGMDANGDGEISAREFLGPAAKFRQLDANADGFVSTDELPADGDETAESQSNDD